MRVLLLAACGPLCAGWSPGCRPAARADCMSGILELRRCIVPASSWVCQERCSSDSHQLPAPLAQVRHLVDVLLQLAESLGGDPEADVRQLTAQASARLAALAEEAAAVQAAAVQGGGVQAHAGGDGEHVAAEFEEVEQAAAAAEFEAELPIAPEPLDGRDTAVPAALASDRVPA